MGNHGHIITKPMFDLGIGAEIENGRILIKNDGKVVADFAWEMAEDVIRAIRQKKLQCEEYAKAPQIARDSGILLRAGAPFVLSARQDIADEAVKMACHDRELRLMPTIKSQEKFGHPVIEVLPPAPKKAEVTP